MQPRKDPVVIVDILVKMISTVHVAAVKKANPMLGIIRNKIMLV